MQMHIELRLLLILLDVFRIGPTRHEASGSDIPEVS